jgi:hypothetical protein
VFISGFGEVVVGSSLPVGAKDVGGEGQSPEADEERERRNERGSKLEVVVGCVIEGEGELEECASPSDEQELVLHSVVVDGAVLE